MIDIGPSLTKLRRDWKDGAVDLPTGMIARRVVFGAISQLAIGSAITIERTGERSLRIVR